MFAIKVQQTYNGSQREARYVRCPDADTCRATYEAHMRKLIHDAMDGMRGTEVTFRFGTYSGWVFTGSSPTIHLWMIGPGLCSDDHVPSEGEYIDRLPGLA